MAYFDDSGVATLTRADEVAAVRAALASTLGEAVGDLDAAARSVCDEMDRIAMAAYDDRLSQLAALRLAGGCERGT